MARHPQETSHGLSIMEAVETLSNIADMHEEHAIGVTKDHHLVVQNQDLDYRSVQWMTGDEQKEALKIVKETFRVVLNYLRGFYREDYSRLANEETMEGVKTIMVLVGEAAKKLDRYTDLFKRSNLKSVKDLKEYRKLQEFYQTRISRKIDEGVLGKWILGLTKQTMARRKASKFVGKEATSTKRVFIDLDSVKKDTEYELFFMRKEDGTRFFNPRLIRNIKLVCDFGGSFGANRGDDPLVDIELWQDRVYHTAAKEILHDIGPLADTYYQSAMRYKSRELVAVLNKALMALMLSANPRNLMRNSASKTCTEYFLDFQVFMRKAFHTRDYEKYVTYSPKKTNKLAHCLLDLTHGICRALYLKVRGYQAMSQTIQNLVKEGVNLLSPEHIKEAERSRQLWNRIACDHMGMLKLIKRHPNGPLIKILDLLDQGGYNVFDPLFQSNLPNRLYTLYAKNHKCVNVRFPVPVLQEFIHKAHIIDEFKAFLRSGKKRGQKHQHLIINMQDRTSWREHFRSEILEELQNNHEFDGCLTVVTLPKDTDFYYQKAPYHDDNHAEAFIAHLKEHLEDEKAGVHFPEKIRKELFPQFINRVIEGVHQVFFTRKNVLTREQRLEFIELVYFFIQLKLLEVVRPDSFSFTCKDGIDISETATAQMFAIFKRLNQDQIEIDDVAFLNEILYAPALLIRERLVHTDRFNRMLNTLKVFELVKGELGSKEFSKTIQKVFGPLFKKGILNAEAVPA